MICYSNDPLLADLRTITDFFCIKTELKFNKISLRKK